MQRQTVEGRAGLGPAPLYPWVRRPSHCVGLARVHGQACGAMERAQRLSSGTPELKSQLSLWLDDLWQMTSPR